MALTALGQFDQAIHHYNKALELSPKSEVGYNNLWVLLAQQEQLDLAIQHFTTAIQLNPRYPKPYLTAALHYNFALQKLGYAGRARRHRLHDRIGI